MKSLNILKKVKYALAIATSALTFNYSQPANAANIVFDYVRIDTHMAEPIGNMSKANATGFGAITHSGYNISKYLDLGISLGYTHHFNKFNKEGDALKTMIAMGGLEGYLSKNEDFKPVIGVDFGIFRNIGALDLVNGYSYTESSELGGMANIGFRIKASEKTDFNLMYHFIMRDVKQPKERMEMGFSAGIYHNL